MAITNINQNTDSFKKIIFKVIGYFFVFNGGIFAIGSFIAIFAEAEKLPFLISFLIAGLLPAYLGLRLVKYANKRYKNIQANETEVMVLSLAARNKGRLTATDLTINLHISLEESVNVLNSFVMKNVADTDINENGSIIYVFRDLLNK